VQNAAPGAIRHVVDTDEPRAIESEAGAELVTDGNENETQHLASPSLWPIGFAIGIACLLVGLVLSVTVLVVGAVIAVVFGWLWVRDLVGRHPPEAAVAQAAAGEPDHLETYDRNAFLSATTIGLGAVIGAAVTVPSLGFMILPSFMGEGVETHDVDLGPISNFPQGKYVIATFTENPARGDVTRRTAFVRNNGPTEKGVPSFSILFSRCVHLGCPVQPNGPFDGDPMSYTAKDAPEVTLQPVLAASFGCPCHGGLYDGEGNRSAGPPVRSLDRFEFSIIDGNLVLGRVFSVANVEGAGAKATIAKYYRAYPGVHVDGIERFLYPIPTPGSTG
jgi:quinol---cytochrome c reductase iron-sulfur subunit, bacillus type